MSLADNRSNKMELSDITSRNTKKMGLFLDHKDY